MVKLRVLFTTVDRSESMATRLTLLLAVLVTRYRTGELVRPG